MEAKIEKVERRGRWTVEGVDVTPTSGERCECRQGKRCAWCYLREWRVERDS